jgi:hypothetical protein
MNPEIKTTYGGIDIFYHEATDQWTFTLRGKDRRASTLTLAKAAIDTPPPADKKPFKRCKAFYKRWSGPPHLAEITSIADTNTLSPIFWLVDGDKRETVSIFDLFAHTDKNQARVDVWLELDKQAAHIERAKTNLLEKMEKFELPKDTEI